MVSSTPSSGHRVVYLEKTFYHILSVARFLIGREPWEMRVHTTARVMNACRECL